MDDSTQGITVLTPRRAVLGPAISAGLVSRGWVVETRSVTQADERVLRAGRVVVVLEDDDGDVQVTLPARGPLQHCVCVGSVRSVSVLLPLHVRGALVLNQTAPLLSLVRLIEHAFADHRGAPPDDDTSRTLRRRRDEHVGLGRLTTAEHAVLRCMVAGFNAAQISGHRYLSTHTIRSQIKSILAKLEVRSQLEAVAVARRSGHVAWLLDSPARFTNSGEDDLLRHD